MIGLAGTPDIISEYLLIRGHGDTLEAFKLDCQTKDKVQGELQLVLMILYLN